MWDGLLIHIYMSLNRVIKNKRKSGILFRVRIPVNCKNFKLFFADDDINSGDHTEPWWSVDTLPP